MKRPRGNPRHSGADVTGAKKAQIKPADGSDVSDFGLYEVLDDYTMFPIPVLLTRFSDLLSSVFRGI